MDDMIGIRLKERRKELGITLVQIHEKTGISTGILSAWERSEKLPSAPSLIKLSDILQCSVDWILFGEQRFQSSLNSETSVSSSCNLVSLESELISSFSELDQEDQEEILDIIKMKIKRKDGRKKSSNSGDKTDIGIA